MKQETHQEKLENLISAEDAKVYSRPERTRALIFFTPRSGSSWLTDLLEKTGQFGYAHEFVNHDFLHFHAHLRARTELDFLNALEQENCTPNQFFSMEVTWGDVERFETIDFMERYRNDIIFHLRRRDIVGQAVSLHLAAQTGVFHKTTKVDLKSRAEFLTQDPHPDIRKWCMHILGYECLTEIAFLRTGIRPVRLFYEDIVADPIGQLKKMFLAAKLHLQDAPSSPYQKLSDAQNERLIDEFNEKHGDFVRHLYQIRPPFMYTP